MGALDEKAKTRNIASQVFENRTEPDQLLTFEQAATCLSITVELLEQWVKKKRVPFVQLSRKVKRFHRRQLQKWIDNRTVWPDEEPLCLYENSGHNASTNEPETAGDTRPSFVSKAGKRKQPSTRTSRPTSGNSKSEQVVELRGWKKQNQGPQE